MKSVLSEEEAVQHQAFQNLAQTHLAQHAIKWELERAFERTAVHTFAQQGLLAGPLPKQLGGLGWTATEFGLFTEAIARHSPSFSGLFNVHNMVLQTLLRWGSPDQKSTWLPSLVDGSKLGAIAFTEPSAGSDLQNIQTDFSRDGNDVVLTGSKKWITCGALADVILVFGKLEEKPTLAIVERETPGLSFEAVPEMLGFRAAHLANLNFEDCRLPKENLVGRPGIALQFVAPYALDWGRISVAWASVGMLRACLEEVAQHALQRKTFGSLLSQHGMIQSLITDMGTQHAAALSLTLHASRSKDAGNSQATDNVLAAKYFSSRAASKQSSQAVQVLGARGCEESGPIARFHRDSKIMEIIEGSSQILEQLLAKRYIVNHANNLSRFRKTAEDVV
jgi:alkylation response protein AidB-like acyl-CoA dehydrogenase